MEVCIPTNAICNIQDTLSFEVDSITERHFIPLVLNNSPLHSKYINHMAGNVGSIILSAVLTIPQMVLFVLFPLPSLVRMLSVCLRNGAVVQCEAGWS